MAAALIPRLNVAVIFLIGGVSLFYLLAVVKTAKTVFQTYRDSWLVVIFGGFCIYLFLNSLWALDTSAALGKAAFIVLIGCMVVFTALAFEKQPEQTLRTAAKAILVGAAISFAVACFEFATGHLIQWSILKAWPAIRPEGNSIQVLVEQNGQVTALPPSQFRNPPPNEILVIVTDGLNRRLSSILLVIWPAILLALQTLKGRTSRLVAGCLAALVTTTILVGASQTAMVALIAGVVMFLAARAWPAVSHRVLLVIWCIALIFTVPLASAPYKAGLHKADWLFASARDRIVIWGFTAEYLAKSPILGIGIRSTRVIGRKLNKTAEREAEFVAPKRLGLHSHNNYLQVWFELGAVGAALVLAIGIALLAAMRRLASNVRPFAYAAFTTACVIAAFGWGLWQSWLITGYSIAFVLICLAQAFEARKRQAAR